MKSSTSCGGSAILNNPESSGRLHAFRYGPEHWVVTPAFAPLFHQHYRRGIAPLLPQACLLKQGSRKAVYLMQHATAEGPRNYYVKVYVHARLLSRFFSIIRAPRGLAEFHTGIAIANRKIPAMVPCAGGVRRAGRVTESYFIAEEVAQAENLAGVLLGEPSAVSRTAHDRFALAKRLGGLIRDIHAHGVFQEDLSLNNFLEGIGNANRGALYLIDFERVMVRARISPARQEWALSKLNRLGQEVSLSQRMRFLHAFRPDLSREDLKALARKIDAATTQRLRQDVLVRSTNTYTTVGYRAFSENGYQGYAVNTCVVKEVLALISHARKTTTPAIIPATLRNAPGEKPGCVTLLHFPDHHDAERHWRLVWGLKTGRLPISTPLALICSKAAPGDSWIVMPAPNDARTLADALKSAPDAAERDRLERRAVNIIQRLHQLHISAQGFSLEAFLVTSDRQGRPCLQMTGLERLKVTSTLGQDQAARELNAIKALPYVRP